MLSPGGGSHVESGRRVSVRSALAAVRHPPYIGRRARAPRPLGAGAPRPRPARARRLRGWGQRGGLPPVAPRSLTCRTGSDRDWNSPRRVRGPHAGLPSSAAGTEGAEPERVPPAPAPWGPGRAGVVAEAAAVGAVRPRWLPQAFAGALPPCRPGRSSRNPLRLHARDSWPWPTPVGGRGPRAAPPEPQGADPLAGPAELRPAACLRGQTPRSCPGSAGARGWGPRHQCRHY